MLARGEQWIPVSVRLNCNFKPMVAARNFEFSLASRWFFNFYRIFLHSFHIFDIQHKHSFRPALHWPTFAIRKNMLGLHLHNKRFFELYILKSNKSLWCKITNKLKHICTINRYISSSICQKYRSKKETKQLKCWNSKNLRLLIISCYD